MISEVMMNLAQTVIDAPRAFSPPAWQLAHEVLRLSAIVSRIKTKDEVEYNDWQV